MIPGDIRRHHGSGNQVRCYRDDHEIWQQTLQARLRAHTKHGANSIEAIAADSPRWLAILVEEVGEVANCLTYDGPTGKLRDELIDVMSVASAWIDAIDAEASGAIAGGRVAPIDQAQDAAVPPPVPYAGPIRPLMSPHEGPVARHRKVADGNG
jgi:hypothetical protein